MRLLPDGPDLTWYPHGSQPPEHDWDGRTLTVRAGAGVDWFLDPVTGADTVSAPLLLAPPVGRGSLAAGVATQARHQFDAGALYAFVDEQCWGKLALERDPAGRLTLVSVVTNGRSDDCNHRVAPDGPVRLRVSVLGAGAVAFHVAEGDGWDLLRVFRLAGATGAGAVTRVGMSSQSPLGDGCRSSFSEISFSDAVPADVRDRT